jgi:HpcH/HpaI aldolase/citrate lyase family
MSVSVNLARLVGKVLTYREMLYLSMKSNAGRHCLSHDGASFSHISVTFSHIYCYDSRHAQKYLVAGAQGILLPQCESKEDVERVVDAVKFPPLGLRGLAGERWNAWGMARTTPQSTPISIAECVEQSNRNSVVGVLVETRRGLDSLEEMLSVEELDLVFIAPTDLSSDLGVHGQIRHPQVLQLVEETVDRIQRYNQEHRVSKMGWHPVSVGTLAVSADDYVYWRDRNVSVLCGVAQCMFVDGAKGFMDAVEDYEKDGGVE